MIAPNQMKNKLYIILNLFCWFSLGLINAQVVATCDISNQGNLQTHEGSQIAFYGNLENTVTGNITESGGQVSFTNSNSPLKIFGENTPVFSELFINVNNNVTLEVPVDVTTGLFFEQGLIITPRNNSNTSINLKDDSINANEADLRHVDGYISFTGNEAITFPVGDDNRLRPLSIDQNASVNTTKAAYFFENAQSPVEFSLSLPFNEKLENISNISNFEFWDLDGADPTRTTLTWDIMSNISQILDSDNLEDLIIVGWNKENQRWESLGNTAFTGDLTMGTITSETFNPDDYEALTFALNAADVGGEEIDITELTVFNGISAGDNNNKNDFLAIKNISRFPDNNLKIFNRWGIKVFDVDGYDADLRGNENFTEPTNAFRGRSNGRITVKEDDLLPIGTYYYILEYDAGEKGGGRKNLAGYIYINR